MAMSNAQRQAAYRARHLKSEDVQDQRLNLRLLDPGRQEIRHSGI
jgi:hypothetical protein